jgi:hypothetical protein
LFAATRDRALSIDEITDNAYQLGGARPTRAQRLSATRAAHRVLRRVRELDERADKLRAEANANTDAALGRSRNEKGSDQEYLNRFWKDPAFLKAKALDKQAERIGVWGGGFWRTARVKGRLLFHPPDVPLEVWAVSIQPAGVIWADTEFTRVTDRNVMVRYAGVVARLDRLEPLAWLGVVAWCHVRVVSHRTHHLQARCDLAEKIRRCGCRAAHHADAARHGDAVARRVRELHQIGRARRLPQGCEESSP